MTDLFDSIHGKRIAARKVTGRVRGLYIASGQDFVTQAVDKLHCDHGGIIGDYHYGMTRRAGGREPWYQRGTVIRNDRQLSLISVEELEKIAGVMGLDAIRPEWIGANIVVEGIADFTLLPAGTVLFFDSGLTLKLNGLNAPCKIAGTSIAQHIGAQNEAMVALNFVKAAKYLRGQTGWVERAGGVEVADKITGRIPEQLYYAPDTMLSK